MMLHLVSLSHDECERHAVCVWFLKINIYEKKVKNKDKLERLKERTDERGNFKNKRNEEEEKQQR